MSVHRVDRVWSVLSSVLSSVSVGDVGTWVILFSHFCVMRVDLCVVSRWGGTGSLPKVIGVRFHTFLHTTPAAEEAWSRWG